MTMMEAKQLSKVLWHYIHGDKVEVFIRGNWEDLHDLETGFTSPIMCRYNDRNDIQLVRHKLQRAI